MGIKTCEELHDALVLFEDQILGVERPGHLGKQGVIEQDRAEHPLFGFDAGRHALLENNVAADCFHSALCAVRHGTRYTQPPRLPNLAGAAKRFFNRPEMKHLACGIRSEARFSTA